MNGELSLRRAPAPPVTLGQAASVLLLSVATVLVYLPAIHAGYVWDDDLHLLNNPVLKPGGLSAIWLPGTYINYWPLTFSTYWLEDKLWGLANPIGFHLVNVLLHVACALLVWQVLRHVLNVGTNATMTAWGSLLAAAVFALHPINVESVAWVTQLKNVLSLFFALSSLWLYLRHERSGEWHWYVLAVATFALSTLAKGIGVTLPALLLALAWWQRERVDRRDIWRVMPFLLIGALMAGVEVTMQKEGQPWEVPRTDSLLSRMAGAGWCVWFYLYKFVWPLNLSFVYPRWTIDSGKLASFVPDVLLLGLALVAWFQRRRWGRGLFMVLFCYVALLLPVLGFTNIYFMRYSLVADHWQYAAMIIPAGGLAAGLTAAARKRTPRFVVAATTVAMLVCLGALTYAQAGIYRDEETLWRDVLKRNPGSWMAHHKLGTWLANRGQLHEAVPEYEAAVRLKVDDVQAHNNLGVVLSRLGRSEEAIASFERALAISGDYALARQNLIREYKRLGEFVTIERDYEAARKYYLRVTQMAPQDAEAHYWLGVSLIETGDVVRAVNELESAVALDAMHLAAHDLLARTLATRPFDDGGDPARALKAALKACAVVPCRDDASRLDTLAIAYASAGRFDQAVKAEDNALELVRRNGSQQHPNDRTLVDTLQAHRGLFRAGKPYRVPTVSPR